jgi:hypothetical protein
MNVFVRPSYIARLLITVSFMTAVVVNTHTVSRVQIWPVGHATDCSAHTHFPCHNTYVILHTLWALACPPVSTILTTEVSLWLTLQHYLCHTQTRSELQHYKIMFAKWKFVG